MAGAALGGKGGSGNTKSTTAPWKPLQPYIKDSLANASDLSKNTGAFYTPLDPYQVQGQNSALGFANNFGSLYNPYMQAGMQGLQAPNVNDNPYLDAYAQAATRPLEQQLNFGTLPGIRSQYTGAGQYGSSRQGVSEGIARGMTNQAIGDTRANIYSNAYGQGLDQQAKTMALYPQMLQAGLMPSSIYGGVGAQNQQDATSQKMAPYQAQQWLSSQINPYISAGGVSKQAGGGSDPLMSLLGAGATGYGLFNLLGGAGAAGAAGGAGGGLGALGLLALA